MTTEGETFISDMTTTSTDLVDTLVDSMTNDTMSNADKTGEYDVYIAGEATAIETNITETVEAQLD